MLHTHLSVVNYTFAFAWLVPGWRSWGKKKRTRGMKVMMLNRWHKKKWVSFPMSLAIWLDWSKFWSANSNTEIRTRIKSL